MTNAMEDHEMQQEELENVYGGRGESESDNRLEESETATGWDTRGNEIQWKKDGEYYHNVCRVCKKEIVHKGSGGFYYCDRCDAIRLTRMDTVIDAGPWGYGHSTDV